MQKKLSSLLLLSLSWLYPAAYLNVADATAAAPALSPQPDQAAVDQAVAYVLTHYHYSRESLAPALSARIFDEYLKELDGGHDYFTQADVASFAAYRGSLGASIKKGDLAPAFAMYTLFRTRFDARMTYVDAQLQKEPDLKSDETLPVGDADAAAGWAATPQQLDERWRKRLKNEVIDLMLNGDDWPKTAQLLKRRYQTLAEGIAKVGSDEVFDSFMNAYAKALDPHTEYFAPVEYQQFKTQMSLKLEGIGVELQGDVDYVKIARILPGSPASRSGELHVGDRIASVAEGGAGDFVDVAGWKLDDVVRLTRGAKGTVVRLKLLPAGAHPGSPEKAVSLTRDSIRLAEAAAKSDVIELPRKGGKARIGVIRVPEFYVDNDARAEGKPDYNSVSHDVRKLLLDLEARHVDGVVLDIRNNGGGSVQEAADLAGLFIPRGPMVQLRSSDDHVDVVRSTSTPVYTGPLAVLVDRLSASASEIFAAAIQDYRRGLIIGSDTYGKGVATQFVDLGELVGEGSDAGQLMFVSDKFYRVTGASTQDRGVAPDIELPSDINPKQFGEETEDNAMPWDTVEGLAFTPVKSRLDAMLPELRKRHETRTQGDPLYKLYVADIDHLKQEDAVTSVSLMLDVRKREEQREEAWRASDDLAWQHITGARPEPTDGAVANPQDAVLREGANIVADMGELQHG